MMKTDTWKNKLLFLWTLSIYFQISQSCTPSESIHPECTVIQIQETHVEDPKLLTYGSNITIKRLLVNETEDVLLELEINIQDQYEVVAYINYDMENESNRTLCSKTCPDYDYICVCESKKEDKRLNYNSLFVIMNLTLLAAKDTLQCLWCKNLVDYVVPGCVQEVGLIGQSDTSANISFNLSEELGRLIGFMNNNLIYHIGLKKLEGINEFLKSFFNAEEDYYYVAIQFEYLTAFTNYTVFVTTFRGEVEGCTTSLTFTTNKSVPLEPPETESFDYIRTLGKNTSSLFLIWQALGQESRGSDKLIYEIWINSLSGCTLRFNRTSNYFNLTNGIRNEPLTVRLWAVNDVGRSENFSEIHVPLNNVTEEPNFIVEFVNKSHAYVNVSVSNDVQQVAVRAIVNKQKGSKDLCEYCLLTQRFIVDVQSVKQTPLKILVPFGEASKKKFHRNVKYCQYDDRSNLHSGFCENATGTVTQMFPDSDITSMLADVDLPTASPGLDISKPLKPVRMPSCFIFSQSYSYIDFSLKILVSLKKNGVFQGMTESQCYYNRQLSTAKVKAFIQDGCLKINQEPDCATKPKQFLIYSFDVYLSQNDKYCNNTQSEKYRHYTRDNLSVLCDLPHGFKFFCIQANGFTSFIATEPIAVPGTAVSHDSSTTQIVAISMTAALVVLLCVCTITLRLICICRDRKKKFVEMAGLENVQASTVSMDNPAANIHDDDSPADSGISTQATHVDDASECTSSTRGTNIIKVDNHADFQNGTKDASIWHSGATTSFNSTTELLATNSSCNINCLEASYELSQYLKQAPQDCYYGSSNSGSSDHSQAALIGHISTEIDDSHYLPLRDLKLKFSLVN